MIIYSRHNNNDMIYTKLNFPTDKVITAIKDGLTDDQIINTVFRGDWSYYQFVVNVRKVLDKRSEAKQ